MTALSLCASRIRECETALSQAKRPADIVFLKDELKRIEDLQELFVQTVELTSLYTILITWLLIFTMYYH